MKKDIRRGYGEQRRRAYPPVAEQLDTIFHEGIEVWRDQIAAIKAEFPKPKDAE